MKTKVVHSQSKDAWNVVNSVWGEKYKLARIPYVILPDEANINIRNKAEALAHAEFISLCFNQYYKDIKK